MDPAQPDRIRSRVGDPARPAPGIGDPVRPGTEIRFAEAGASLETEWEALAERLGAGPFVRPWWIRVWWRSFGTGRLRVATARRHGRLVALLAVQSRHGVMRSPTNWHTPAFGLLAEDDAAAAALLDAMPGGRQRRVDLSFLEAGDVGRVQAAAARHGRRVIARALKTSPFIPLDGDWESFERNRSKNFRSDLRRRRRRLEEAGRVTVDLRWGAQPMDGLPQAVEEAIAVEGLGWKAEQGTAIASDPGHRRFMTEMAMAAAEAGALYLAFLRLDGRAVASEIGLEGGGVHYSLKAGFDPEFARFSPGRLLMRETLRDLMARGFTEMDLLGDFEDYKGDWTNTARQRYRVQAFAPTAAGLVDWTAFTYGRPVAKRAVRAVRARQR